MNLEILEINGENVRGFNQQRIESIFDQYNQPINIRVVKKSLNKSRSDNENKKLILEEEVCLCQQFFKMCSQNRKLSSIIMKEMIDMKNEIENTRFSEATRKQNTQNLNILQPDKLKDESKNVLNKQDNLSTTSFFEKNTNDFTFVDPKEYEKNRKSRLKQTKHFNKSLKCNDFKNLMKTIESLKMSSLNDDASDVASCMNMTSPWLRIAQENYERAVMEFDNDEFENEHENKRTKLRKSNSWKKREAKFQTKNNVFRTNSTSSSSAYNTMEDSLAASDDINNNNTASEEHVNSSCREESKFLNYFIEKNAAARTHSNVEHYDEDSNSEHKWKVKIGRNGCRYVTKSTSNRQNFQRQSSLPVRSTDYNELDSTLDDIQKLEVRKRKKEGKKKKMLLIEDVEEVKKLLEEQKNDPNIEFV